MVSTKAGPAHGAIACGRTNHDRARRTHADVDGRIDGRW
jgi:hypothetical protein